MTPQHTPILESCRRTSCVSLRLCEFQYLFFCEFTSLCK